MSFSDEERRKAKERIKAALDGGRKVPDTELECLQEIVRELRQIRTYAMMRGAASMFDLFRHATGPGGGKGGDA